MFAVASTKNGAVDVVISNIIAGGRASPAQRKSLARLIQKVYKVDSLVCPKCREAIKIIALIEQSDIIKKILTHVGLWGRPNDHHPGHGLCR